MLALCYCANNWESEETSEVVVQNSIIYEQDMPQAGASAVLSKETPDELIKIAKLESQIAQLEEDKQLLEQENNQLIEENQELKELGTLTKAEWNLFYKVVRAEAGANSKQAQKNVAYVILNRIKSGKFPNTLTEVIYQKSQFSLLKKLLQLAFRFYQTPSRRYLHNIPKLERYELTRQILPLCRFRPSKPPELLNPKHKDKQ